MKKIVISLLFFILAPVLAFAIEGKVVGVSDGDTITLLTAEKQQVKVRLYGVDCPEKSQDFGQKAKQFTSDLVFGKTVSLETVDQDRYGRTVGIISVDNKILNEELLKNGFAWHYAQYCKRPECPEWKTYEESARNYKAGLWAGNSPVPPWDFRHGSKSQKLEQGDKDNQKEKPVADGGYSGNVKSMVFHQSSCKNFQCKNCTEHFKTREEAIQAGYKPCGACKP